MVSAETPASDNLSSLENGQKHGQISIGLYTPFELTLSLDKWEIFAHIGGVRAHGMWTYEPRQGRKAATVVCSVSAVVTLTPFNF